MNREEEKLEVLNELYNLILSKHIREWERKLILDTKNRIENQASLSSELSRLEAELRPLALRRNLTPQVAAFYQKMTSEKLFGRGVGGIL